MCNSSTGRPRSRHCRDQQIEFRQARARAFRPQTGKFLLGSSHICDGRLRRKSTSPIRQYSRFNPEYRRGGFVNYSPGTTFHGLPHWEQFPYFDSNVLRLPADKRKEYYAQVDRLVAELSSRLKDHDEIRITRVTKSGSFAKYTILRKTSTDPLDVDVVFYISGREISEATLQGLNDTIHALLLDVYPNKKVEDFEIQRKATTVTFIGSGISVDVVPVIADESRDGYGWQFDLNDGEVIESCAPCQIKFVRDRKNMDSDYRTLVRLAKKWRNYYEVDPLKSFHIELILAFILDQEGSDGSVEQRFRRFLLYIAETGLQQTVSFPENPLPLGTFDDPVVIIDPICSTNNVAARITENERVEIVKAAEESWETAQFSSVENDHKEWKSLFGPGFKTEEE